jgi:uracil-DNA glycosylase family 4
MKSIRNSACKACALHKGVNTVCLMGVGPVPCRAMIIGEAPGGDEDESGIPFMGDAGSFLRRMLTDKDVDLDPKTLYITNIAKCKPPKNRRPKKPEITTCAALYLGKEIEEVRPSVILLLGATAISWAKGEKTAVKKSEGSTFEKGGITYVPSHHPSRRSRRPAIFKKNLLLFRDALKKAEPKSF